MGGKIMNSDLKDIINLFILLFAISFNVTIIMYSESLFSTSLFSILFSILGLTVFTSVFAFCFYRKEPLEEKFIKAASLYVTSVVVFAIFATGYNYHSMEYGLQLRDSEAFADLHLNDTKNELKCKSQLDLLKSHCDLEVSNTRFCYKQDCWNKPFFCKGECRNATHYSCENFNIRLVVFDKGDCGFYLRPVNNSEKMLSHLIKTNWDSIGDK